jgi:type 1 glutamine amidotransferase
MANKRTLRPFYATTSSVVLLAAISWGVAVQAETPTRVLIVVGPSTHGPGTHEVGAGGRLAKYCLEHAENVRGIEAEVVSGWPADPQRLEGVASVVFTGDRFPPEEMPGRDRTMADLEKMMDRGCGLVCIHYATGLNAKHVAADGSHPLLGWMGGYFATGCPHHKSIAKVFTATIEPTTGDHPVLRGWKAFTLRDEPYIKNYFGPNGPEPNVTALATSLLPPEAPERETVAWAVSRADGGRGMGVVMPHFYRNWQMDDLRTLILNGIVWSAKLDVPSDGVRVKLPDLATFEPAAVEPQLKPKK